MQNIYLIRKFEKTSHKVSFQMNLPTVKESFVVLKVCTMYLVGIIFAYWWDKVLKAGPVAVVIIALFYYRVLGYTNPH